MVRFKDKKQILSNEISESDIMPITDKEDNDNDKKISIGQLNEYFGNNISTFATTDLANTDMLVDAILEAPNGVMTTNDAKNTILVKQGLKVLFASGRQSNGKLKNTAYTVTADKTQSTTNIANGHYVLFINSSGSIVYIPIAQVYVSRTKPTVTTTAAYWYDIESNYWKITNNTGSTWTNTVINNLGQFKVASGLVTEIIANTPIYIPSPEAIMVRDLSNITSSGEQDIKDLVQPNIDKAKTDLQTDIDSKQDKLIAGDGITITDNIISAGTVSSEWGNITGDIDDQTDLKNKLAVQNMYETGAVSTDAQGYNQLLSMKHSSFDQSKFTIVGSPTITDDGVASGFSNDDYLYIPNSLSNTYNTFEIMFKFRTGASRVASAPYIIGTGTSTIHFLIAWASAGYFSIYLSSNNSTWDIASAVVGKTKVVPNTDYWMKFIFDGTKYIVYVSTDGINYSPEILVNSSVKANIPTNLLLGCVRGGVTNYTYDLTQISITVDGKEVFSGNKTGIDTIKADNYEVVGSPTITDDGVLQDCGNSTNYITIDTSNFNSDLETKAFKLEYRAKLFSAIDNKTMEIGDEFGTTGLNIGNGNSNGTLYIQIVNTTSQVLSISQAQLENHLGEFYNAEFISNGTNYSFKTTFDDGTVFETSSSIETPFILPSILQVGKINSLTTGSIDLNSFKIYVDGNLVYQPCLKIPYTQSKTGSKIVDGVYKDRVQDLYEQTGIASYYTIDETNQNFTLPMGEIYGMIEKNSYTNGYQPPLFMPQWADHELGNTSFLRADTFSWHNGATYSNGYNELLSEYNNSASTTKTDTIGTVTITYKLTPKGYKICVADQVTNLTTLYNNVGIAWYYVLDTTNTQFKLPRTKWGFKGLRNNVGNIIAETLPNITGSWSGAEYFTVTSSSSGAFTWVNANGGYSGGYGSAAGAGFTFDASKSSSIYKNGAHVQEQGTQMYLYFYIGQYTPEAVEQTAGLNAELFNNKMDRDLSNRTSNIHFVTQTYQNGTSWYRIYDDNWCEQGGVISGTTTTLLKPYKNTNYTIFLGYTAGTDGCWYTNNKKTSSFQQYVKYYGINAQADSQANYWKACGYIA